MKSLKPSRKEHTPPAPKPLMLDEPLLPKLLPNELPLWPMPKLEPLMPDKPVLMPPDPPGLEYE